MIKMQFKKIITCEGRLTGKCTNCEINYNPNHHPNNLDCIKYKKAIVRTFEVKSKWQLNQYLLSIGRYEDDINLFWLHNLRYNKTWENFYGFLGPKNLGGFLGYR